MEIKFLEYQLSEDGYIHNWLVAGPQIAPVDPQFLPAQPGEEWKTRLSNAVYTAHLAFTEPPADRAYFETAGEKLRWRYMLCRDDHFIHASGYYPAWSHARTWALTQLNFDRPQLGSLELVALGPVDLWLNGIHICRSETFPRAGQAIIQQSARFESGVNQLVVRFEQVGRGDCPNLLAVRFISSEAGAKKPQALVPTLARRPARQMRLEKALEGAYLESVVSHRGNVVNLRWADDLQERVNYAYQLQDDQDRIYVEGKYDADPENALNIGHPTRIFERPLRAVLHAVSGEYFEQNLRYQRDLPLMVLDNSYTAQPYGTYAGRLRAALEDAARYETDLFGQVALLQLGRQDQFQPQVVQDALHRINAGEPGSELLLNGVLTILVLFAERPDFPGDLKTEMLDCAAAFLDRRPLPEGAWQPGDEGDELLRISDELLASQLFSERRHSVEPAVKAAQEWMLARARQGFRAWDSPDVQEKIVVALLGLLSHAKDIPTQELAAVLLDKVFFGWAVNSFKGIFGASHGQASAGTLKSAQLEATAGLMRILWGAGIFNFYIAATVSLACSTYEFPLPIAAIAMHFPEEMNNRERSLVDPDRGIEVNKVTFRTPDGMLSSTQRYRPGQPGTTEHIWQATLGPEALVFVNHPASLGEHEALKPGFWRGNACLPDVAQWKDVLVAVHSLPQKDWLGFTHAYFPVHCFDEVLIADGWAYARKGEGYLAITAQQRITLVKRAPDAFHELRSPGQHNTWVCMLGRTANEGSFANFQHKVRSLNLQWRDLGVRLSTLRGDVIDFGWEAPLTVNGQAQPLDNFKHFENPYCTAEFPAESMDINDGENIMRLNFS